MRNLFYLTVFFLFSCCAAVFAVAPSRVQVNGTWYTNGQVAYIECSKTSVALIIDVVTNGTDILKMRATSSSNLSISNTASDVQKTLNLDAARQNGYIDVGYVNNTGEIRVYIQQRPPAPTVTGSNVCAGHSASFTANSSYAFQSTKPMNFVWQSTGGVTVNGGSIVTALPGVSSTVTIANSSSGTYSVKAVVPSCSNLESTLTSANLGTPVITNPSYSLFDPGSNMWQFTQISGYPSVTYAFTVTSGSASIVQNYGDAYITTSSGATICVSGTNSCGTGTSYCFYIPGAGGMLKTIYPNPASNLLSLEFADTESANSIPFQVVLYSEKSGEEIKNISADELSRLESYKANHKIEMDVSKFPRGTYYIHVISDEKSKLPVRKERIILE
ncbi:T9SS type A sorting domain-containing protein [Dyadobacter luticola]|uniref:Secretion system C-terminal sorting domain-containing protein n=1 Tax=Dyadobacter luticola TaxID=1979387 RepID=A0A5R9L1Q0_9BACT|nr:T9SS type A sorting domain-containing protein [Dyadobacter luticola]TLV02476.1 hypothetical protein FEN17_02275 [Dyadobacter luticola]